jgi:hypothetical protein
MKKRIVVAGLYRSGTTFLFNALRRVLALNHGEDFVYDVGNEYFPISWKPYHLVKWHQWSPWLAENSLIVCSHRPLEEVRKSYERVTGLPVSDKMLDIFQWWYEKWAREAVVDIPYSQIDRRPKEAVLHLLSSVNEPLPCPVEEVVEYVDSLRPNPNLKFDPKTYLWQNHRQDWSQKISDGALT